MEGTISLFKNEEPQPTSIPTKRIIQIKTNDFFVEDNKEDNTPNEKERLLRLQDEIDTATKQLQLIKDEQAELILRTKKEIQDHKEKWEKEKEIWIAQAKEEGFKQGFSTGESKALEKYEESIHQINSIIELANQDYHAMIAKSDETITEIAIRVAEKVIQRKITEDPSNFLNIVKAAIKELQDQSVIMIYLHPENYPFIMEHKQELSQILEENMKLSIYVKEDLSKNSCIIEHPFGQIDASVDTQLSQIRQILLDVVQENSNG